MKRLLALLLFAASANAATIGGTVTADGGALPAMTVAAYTAAGALQASASTNGSGAYSLTVPNGSYRLLAYDPNGTYATSFYADAESFETSTILAAASSPLTNVDFHLVRAGSVSGHVTSAAGEALPNMTVAAYNADGTRRGFTTSDAGGAFRLVLPPGSYKIGAYDDALGYVPAFYDGAPSFAAATAISIAAAQSTTANVTLPPAAKLAGSVADRTTLAPLAAMRVTAYAADGTIAARTLAGSDGRFAMAARPGALRLVADDPAGNYATTFVPDAESFSAEPAVSAAGGQTLSSAITMVRGGRLAGRVADRATGAPLAGITAVAYNADGTTRTFAASDAAGAYSIVVPPGDYRVGAFDAALFYLPQFYSAQPAFAGASVVHAFAQQSAGGFDFALAKGARVAGRVTSAATGAPLPAMSVGAYDTAGRLLTSATTDASGNYVLLLTSATVKLIAFDTALRYANAYDLGAPTFAAAPARSLVEGTSIVADFAMPEAGRISGTVVAASGLPLAGMQVIVYDAAFATVVETATDAAGAFRVAVPAGVYTVAAADPAHRYAGASYSSPLNVAVRQDLGPIGIQLAAVAAAPPRRRAAKH
jgi:hypothetical protein